MRKLIAVIAVVVLSLSMACAVAEQAESSETTTLASKATEIQEASGESYDLRNINFVMLEDTYGKYIQVYAEVENKKDAPLEMKKSTVLLYHNQKLVDTIDFVQMYPLVLENKGEVGYLATFTDVQEDIDDVQVVFKEQEKSFFEIKRYPVGDIHVVELPSVNNTVRYCIEAAVNNETEEVAYDLNVSFVIKEKETGKIVDIEEKGLFNNTGILPASSIMVRQELRGMDELDMEKYEITGMAYTTTLRPILP